MNKALPQQYYYRSNGRIDKFTKILSAIDSPLYFILKSTVEDIENPFEIFLRDITFFLLKTKEDSIYNIDFVDNTINDSVFKVRNYRGDGFKSLYLIESLLEGGEFVIIQTDTRRLPFFKNFTGISSPAEGATPGHVFLAVGYDDTNLYYVEAPWNINPKNFTPLEGNKSIGVINKQDLRHAFEVFLNYITCKIDTSALYNYSGRLKTAIDASIINYNKKSLITSDFKIYYGKEAIEGLIDVCGKECFYLNQSVPSYSLDLYGLLYWKLSDIVHRRKLLYHSLLKVTDLINHPSLNKVIATIETNVKLWHRVILRIIRRNLEGKYLIDSSLQKYFIDIAPSEEDLINSLKELKAGGVWKAI